MTPQDLPIEAGIQYDNYAAVICYLDKSACARAGQVRDSPTPPDHEIASWFGGQCAEYRRGIKNETRQWAKANGFDPDDEEYRWPDYLYKPVCYSSFSNTDCVSLLCSHTLDVLPNVTSEILAPVAHASLAFCPKLDTLGVSREESGYFCEYKDLFVGIDPDSEDKRDPGFSEEQPLLAITQIGLSSLSIMGPGLIFMRSALTAIILKVNQTVAELTEKFERDDPTIRGLFKERGEIESLRCVLLDSLDWADLGLIILCRNYSLAMTIVAAVQSITMQELYDADARSGRSGSDLQSLASHPKLSPHPWLAHIARERYSTPARKQAIDDSLSGTHAILTTYTSLCMSHRAVHDTLNQADEPRQDGSLSYGGYVSQQLICDPMHGHLRNLLDSVLKTFRLKKLRHESDTNLSGLETMAYTLFSPGKDGLTIGDNRRVGESFAIDPSKSDGIVALSHAVRLRQALINEFFTGSDLSTETGEIPSADFCGHVRHFSTSLGIPIPLLDVHPAALPEGHIHLARILRDMTQRVFDVATDAIAQYGSKEPSGYEGTLSIKDLTRRMRRLGVPSSLCKAITYLFFEYAKALQSPQLVSAVVDLYENFLAIFHLFEEMEKNIPAWVENSDFRQSSFLDGEDSQNLVELITSIRDALVHRTQVSANTVEDSDVAIDLRGGMNQLLDAADVAMKCGVGLVRRILAEDDELFAAPSGKQTGISRAGIDPSARVSQLHIGEVSDLLIGTASLSVDHLTRAESIADYFHEAAHLLLNLLVTSPPEQFKSEALNVLRRSEIKEIYQEVFVEQFTLKLMFGNDWKLFTTFYLSTMWIQPVSNSRSRAGALCKVMESVMRCFCIIDPIRCALDEGPSIYDSHEKKQDREIAADEPNDDELAEEAITELELLEATDRFKDVIQFAKRFFLDFDKIYDVDCERHFIGEFRDHFPGHFKTVKAIWRVNQQVYGNYASASVADQDPEVIALLTKKLCTVLDTGRPVVAYLREVRETGMANGFLDPLFIIRILLGEFVRSVYGPFAEDKVKNIHIIREPQLGHPEFEDGNWHGLLLDRVKTGFFVANPKMGADLFQKRVTMIKSMWDISCTLKSRRLRLLLKASWNDLPNPYSQEKCQFNRFDE